MKVENADLEKAISHLIKIPEFAGLQRVSEKFIDLSRDYLNLLLLWNETHDLVGPPKSIEEYLLTHFTDSLASFFICNMGEAPKKLRYMDIGTGAGIPGFFWHFLYLDRGFEVETILLEPREKRVHFMEEAIRELALKNIYPLKERIDGLPKHKLEFIDIYTARAIKLSEKDLKIIKKIDPDQTPQILWLTGPEVEVPNGWRLLQQYNLMPSSHGRRAYLS